MCNHQQARIEAYLNEARQQFQQDGAVDAVVLTNLAAAGYPLASLDDDLND